MLCLMLTNSQSDNLPYSGHSLLYLLTSETLLETRFTFLTKLKHLLNKISSVMKSSLHQRLKFDLIYLVLFANRQLYSIDYNNFHDNHHSHFTIIVTFHQFNLNISRSFIMIPYIYTFLGLLIGNSLLSHGHPCGTEAAEDTIDAFLEKPLFGVFKVWHLVMIGMLIAIIATIVACCIMRCRIPRTKQEIEADAIRKKVTKQFRAHLNKIPIEGMELIKVLNEVKEYEEDRIKKGTIEEKKTLMKRLKALFKSDSMERSMSKDDADEGSINEKPGLTNPKLTNTIVSITSDNDPITVSSPTPSLTKEKY